MHLTGGYISIVFALEGQLRSEQDVIILFTNKLRRVMEMWTSRFAGTLFVVGCNLTIARLYLLCTVRIFTEDFQSGTLLYCGVI